MTGDEVSKRATKNFLSIIYKDHTSAIGGNSCYERFGRPGEISKRLGFTANETCNTYNMLKVSLNYFESSGDLQYMDYFEKALYNHILASQDPESGGVTYYTTLMPGHFKSFSNKYNLEGVWCCVGTGMENHSKYGESVFFHNNKDVLVNLFIPSQLSWQEKGLTLSLETKFPEEDNIVLTVKENKSFGGHIYLRYPSWVKRNATVTINDVPVNISAIPGEYIRLVNNWKAGDKIKINLPQAFQLEAANDNPNLVAIFHGPILLAGELGAAKMPGSDLVNHAHYQYRDWIPPTDDIPTLVVDKTNLNSWIKDNRKQPLHFNTINAGVLNDKKVDVSLIPYYQMRHQRMNVYWKLYSKDEMALRKEIVSDEINVADALSEKNHQLKGEHTDTSRYKDKRTFWENNRIGRRAEDGGWYSYEVKLNKNAAKNYLTVTYWGGVNEKYGFDILLNDKAIATKNIYDQYPLTYYEEVYELPSGITNGKDKAIIQFRSKGQGNAVAIYGLKISVDPEKFSGYSFY